jgi:2'-5' RNA ligase
MGDQPDYTGSCMIALYPPPEVAGALAVPDGLDPDDMHITIAYTGDAADVDPEALNAAAKALASRPPFTAMISGHARFTGGEQDCIVALADSPTLEKLRGDARAALGEQGIAIPSEHGFVPHLTIRYLGADEDDPVGRLASFPVTFTAVSAVHGKDRTDYPLASDPELPQLAAEAYLTGWALSGGPLTERATPGCAAAIAAALGNAHDPRVLEVTLDLGKLEGTWALVYKRREDLIADHVGKIQVIWRKAAKHLDAGRMVRSFRQQAGLTRESKDPWVEVLRAEAIAAAAGLLNGIRSGPEFGDLVAAIELSLAASMAEGKTAALAVAAEQAGQDGFDWDLAYSHMYEPLTHLEDLPGAADEWVQRLIDGNAGDIGRALASLAGNGGTYDDMVSTVADLTSGSTIRAVQTLIDYMMTGSANQGALNLYASEGVTHYDVLTAGDARVCPACEQAEQDNPHELAAGAEPVVPEHVGCRCAVAVSLASKPFSAFTQFLKTAA